jgi:hypothetical protein
MLSDEIRARLARLHAAEQPAPGDQPRAISAVRSRQQTARSDRQGETPFSSNPLLGGVECQNASGSHLRFRRPVADFWPTVERTLDAIDPHRSPAAQCHPELAALARSFPRETLFLDLETCGFAGSMVFLAGLVWHDQTLVVDQLFARNYAEERALLESLWQIAGRKDVLVTFNGKSFDWPMVHDRSTRHHLGRDARGQGRNVVAPRAHCIETLEGTLGRHAPRPELLHCDLLHHARRRWKRLLPNCRLQTLEWHVCRRVRHDDLPGAQVPAAYHEYVRTGQTHRLGSILQHNALDLVTLAQLACRLLAEPADAVPLAKRA